MNATVKRLGRMWIKLLIIVAAAYAGICLLVFLLQARLVYLPTREIAAHPDAAGLPYEPVALTTSDGLRLSAWFVPAGEPRGAVLFCHGNAGNISYRFDTLRILHDLGLSTLIFDYRGYGESEGRPNEDGTYRDAEAAWRWLIEEKGMAPERIVVFGRSLGGGVASWLAAEHPPGALVLESTFTSLPDMGAWIYPFLPVRLLARIHYPTLERMPKLACPVLVAHSRDDTLVPYDHGRRLFEAAAEPKAFLELQGDHNGGFMDMGQAYPDGLDAFISQHIGGRAASRE